MKVHTGRKWTILALSFSDNCHIFVFCQEKIIYAALMILDNSLQAHNTDTDQPDMIPEQHIFPLSPLPPTIDEYVSTSKVNYNTHFNKHCNYYNPRHFCIVQQTCKCGYIPLTHMHINMAPFIGV